MVKELLELRPRQYLCPFCGTWHQWNERDTLQSRSNSDRWTQTIFGNESMYPKECAYGGYAIAVRPHVDERVVRFAENMICTILVKETFVIILSLEEK